MDELGRQLHHELDAMSHTMPLPAKLHELDGVLGEIDDDKLGIREEAPPGRLPSSPTEYHETHDLLLELELGPADIDRVCSPLVEAEHYLFLEDEDGNGFSFDQDAARYHGGNMRRNKATMEGILPIEPQFDRHDLQGLISEGDYDRPVGSMPGREAAEEQQQQVAAAALIQSRSRQHSAKNEAQTKLKQPPPPPTGPRPGSVSLSPPPASTPPPHPFHSPDAHLARAELKGLVPAGHVGTAKDG